MVSPFYSVGLLSSSKLGEEDLYIKYNKFFHCRHCDFRVDDAEAMHSHLKVHVRQNRYDDLLRYISDWLKKSFCSLKSPSSSIGPTGQDPIPSTSQLLSGQQNILGFSDIPELDIDIPELGIDIPEPDIDIPELGIDIPEPDIDISELGIDNTELDIDNAMSNEPVDGTVNQGAPPTSCMYYLYYTVELKSLKDHLIPIFAVLQSSELLSKCGLVYHSGLKILICLSCSAAFIPDHIISHQKGQHDLKITKSDMGTILSTFSVCKDTKVPIPLPLQAPIEGIKVEKKGLQCIKCNFVFLSHKTMDKHWKDHHESLRKDIWRKDRFYLVDAQTIFLSQSGSRHYFSVDSSSIEDIPGNPFTLFMQQHGSQSTLILPTSPPTRDRDIPILVKRLKWYHHLQEYCEDAEKRTQLLDMAAAPGSNSGALSGLSQVTKAYLAKIQSEESQVTMMVLMCLKNYPV